MSPPDAAGQPISDGREERRCSAGRVRVANMVMRIMAVPSPMAIDARRPFRIGGVHGPDAEHAFDAADNATDRAADDRPNGARRLISHISSVRDAVGNALSFCRHRRSERCGECGCK